MLESAVVRRFEVVSRGDFVPGTLCTPLASKQPGPLLIIPHGLGDDSGVVIDRGAMKRWTESGLSLALIDLPLYGQRSSPKLSERLQSGVAATARGEALDADTGALVEEFSRQSTSDLIRTVDALAALPEIDDGRIGFLGFGVGAVAGSYLLGHDARIKAAVLGNVGGGHGPAALDPATYIAQVRGASLLFADGEASGASYEAAPEPKRHARSSDSAPNEAIWSEIESFLRDAL